MMFVVGSGPAGVACATALLARGLDVTMLDAGVKIPPDKAEILKSLKVHWDEAQAEQLKHKLDASNPIKLSYNSAYPYSGVADHVRLRMEEHIHCMPSFAQGGLSNAWGAFVAPYSAEDMQGWPITRAQLAPAYDAIFSLLPRAVSAESHEAAASTNVYRPSAQATLLLARWRGEQDALQAQGIEFSPAELAVKFGSIDASICNYSGYCQHGCPLDLIYSARHTLTELMKNPKFRYVPDVVVTAMHETTEGIIIESHDRNTKEPRGFEGERVFSACGTIISTMLALEAMSYGEKVTFRDSMHFMVPGLMRARAKNVERERLHTLAQLYFKIRRPEITPNPVHLQIYTYMDHYTERLKQLLRFAYSPLHPLTVHVIDRLIALQGHLHSDDSHGFTMRLDNNKTAYLETVHNSRAEGAISAVMKHMRSNARNLGFTPILPMKSISKIGKSFHYGASLPMSEKPKYTQTDTLGRPFGLSRWHIVDATVLPSIPAGSITPSIMANAYRIATECPL